MFKKINKIFINNGVFFNNNVLTIFDKEKHMMSIIYGQNGTGKTTLGNAINNLKNHEQSNLTSYFLDYRSNQISMDEQHLSNIYVFNEDFVDEQVKFDVTSSKKVKSIVMFGESVKYDQQINEIKIEIKANREEFEKLELDKYQDNKNILSPEYHKNLIVTNLRSGWASEEQEIKGLSRKASVDDNITQKVINAKFPVSFNNETYQIKKTSYLNQTNNIQKIESNGLTKLLHLNIPIKEIENVLKKQYSWPVDGKLTERISKTITSRLEEIKNDFNEGYCPYCFRDINEKEIKEIVDEINLVQNKEIKAHQEELNELIQEDLYINLDDFEVIDKELCYEIKKLVDSLNLQLNIINEKIYEKINSPYDSLSLPQIDCSVKQKLILKAKELETKRIQFNNDIDNRDKIKSELLSMNINKAALENEEHINNYFRQQKEYNEKKDKEKELDKALQQMNSDIVQLNANKANISIALDMINDYLTMIFLEKDRLKLVVEDNNYVVKCRGNNIKLKDLSNGEKNAISLCYFFASINQNVSAVDTYQHKMLVVLDDPLSSFDYNHKIGIYSFLRKIFNRILENDESRIIILTHQIDSYFDLLTISNDVVGKGKTSGLLLQNKETNEFIKDSNLYKYHINEIFDLIVTDIADINDEKFSGFGNKLRRIIEAFSTFNYGVGMSKITRDDVVLQSLNDPKLVDYFANSMSQIFLNQESHMQNQTYNFFNLNDFPFNSKEDLIHIAKDVFSLIFLLNKPHLEKMLGEKYAQNIEIISNHIEAIKNN